MSLGRLIDWFKKTEYAALLLLIFLGGSLPRIARADAGVLIPTVNYGFTGRAPDLGALELGKPEPTYGPRWLRGRPFYR